MVESNQKMPSTPTLRSIDFYFLRAGIQQVSAEGDIITGVWESPIPDDVRRDIEGHLPLTWPPRLPGPGATVEEFVNTRRDIQAVARFTKRYGPLEEDPRDGAKFRFPVASWFEWQTRLQSEWRFIASGRWRDLGAIVHHRQPYPRDTWWFDVVEGRLLYRARLRDFLEFDLWSLRPLERVRFCAWPQCPRTPYFIALIDLRQKYCSQSCAHEATKKSKRESIARARASARKPRSSERR